MTDPIDVLWRIGLTGIGATACMDLWTVLRKRLFGVASLDYALVGRWVAHMRAGRFRHPAIAKASPRPGERAIGWSVHYLSGIALVALPLLWSGADWLHRPSLPVALGVGLGSVVLPFFVMQPAFGFGIAARLTANPQAARWRSVTTHLAFGLGLFIAASAVASGWPR
ncbi:DUF2938 domain-containing protein [Jeongeupia chitinilytica]|uniref:DUF2938 domain-containing protein n=1 Tax=Jeongeupia chitinilytica TaxID=1041641 RepID=A0ABQ3H133_9NEIS|nr:DUF2938 domain-containing protein [Jeongeupia chitinilytica]GHD64237.1 hypothetical protein GCM10007350_22880 [Jeongeupia chitinilytica]